MRLPAVVMALAMAALGVAIGPRPAAAQPAAPATDCAPGARLQFICGLRAPEDLVQIPGSNWIVVSGLGDASNRRGGGGGLALIDAVTRTASKVTITGSSAGAPYDGCAGPPDPARFSAHGLNILPRGRGRSRLFVVGHGAREAVEVFDVVSGKGPPVLTWIGCVPAPAGAYNNSVAALPDGRIVVTDFLHAPSTFRDIFAGHITGAVYLWKPGGVFEKLPGTDLAGANGVEVSPDLRYLFVAVSGTSLVLRYQLAATEKPPTVIKPGLRTDNLRWAPDGRLLLAGPDLTACPPGVAQCPGAPAVKALDPKTLALTPVLQIAADPAFPALSTAIIVGKVLWLGSPTGDRVAYMPLGR